ncbi:MAG: glycosyl transferase group 1 [Gemmatimonadetes bacterium]|nr:glycosyl transferase group 1 [Gemmatimonadota bacterium]
MKLAILLHGGVDRSGEHRVIHAFLWLIERLVRNHEVHVFSFNQEPEPGEWDLLGAHVHNVGTVRGWRRRLFNRFAAEHRKTRFDVIHAIFSWGAIYAALLGARHRLPVLYHAEGGDLVGLTDIGFGVRCTARGRVTQRAAVRGATRVSVPSIYMQRLAADLGIDAEVVPIGIALDKWAPSPPRLRDLGRPARLLHVGDLRPVKGQDALLEAAGLLRDDGLDFVLDIVGLDTMNAALQRSSAALALGDSVQFHGHLDRDALRSLMLEADVLIVSSRHEGGPFVLLEAALAGVPTVGTAVGHIFDWAPRAAVSVPIGDAEALARETAALLADEPRRLDIAAEAQRRAIAHDADYTAAAFERIYDELVNR